MTILDLRIKYKSEMGLAPTYGRYGEDDQLQLLPFHVDSCNYKGGLTHEYAEWLERNAIKRKIYQRDTAEYGTYKDRRGITRYTHEYKNWLEERLCEIYSNFKK
jgi:hypothetical protein